MEPNTTSKVRINKFLADCGVASRRICDSIINKGVVTINGVIAKNGDKVDPEKDEVRVNDKLLDYSKKDIYIILNKPVDYITSTKDEWGRKTVFDLLSPEDKKRRTFPVGRLDYNSQGLVLLTNNGEITHKITHPKHHLEKEYEVIVEGIVTEGVLQKLRTGINIGDYITRDAVVEVLEEIGERAFKLKFILNEGKHRQIRLMCKKVGLGVAELKRVRIGNITLGDLKEGTYRYLNPEEIEDLTNIFADL